MTSVALKNLNIIRGRDSLLEYHQINESYDPVTDFLCVDIETYQKVESKYGGLVPHLSNIKTIQVLVFSINNGEFVQKDLFVYVPTDAPAENYREFIQNVLKGKRIVGHNILFDLLHIFYNAKMKIDIDEYDDTKFYDTKLFWLKYFMLFNKPEEKIYSWNNNLLSSLKDLCYIFGVGELDKTVRGKIYKSKDVSNDELIYAANDVIFTGRLFTKMMNLLTYDRHIDMILKNTLNVCLGDLDQNTFLCGYFYSRANGYSLSITSENKCALLENMTKDKYFYTEEIDKNRVLTSESIFSTRKNILFFDQNLVYFEKDASKKSFVCRIFARVSRFLHVLKCKIFS